MRTLGIAACLAVLAACGQRGPLYLPTDPAAAQRASLPQTLIPGTAVPPAAPASAAQ